MLDPRHATNPIFGPSKFKIGLFAYAHESAIAMTTVPERWMARWDDIETMARMADVGGIDFLLPLARWKGFPSKTRSQYWNYDTLAQAAALATITKRIGVFSTIHTPLVHPIIAAKQLATIDHASHGRAGLNIVCGWNSRDFDMFGAKVTSHDDRYQQGAEWVALVKKILLGTNEEFDYNTPYFPNLKKVIGQPGSIQTPHPATISAAYSEQGRELAVKTSDFILIGYVDEKAETSKDAKDIADRSAAAGRAKPPEMLAMLAPFVRETRQEAEDFFRYFAVDNADEECVANFTGARSRQTAPAPKGEAISDKLPYTASAGGIPLVGTPQDIVDSLLRIHKQGFSGATFTLPHFIRDMPIITERVLPLMKEAGLRV